MAFPRAVQRPRAKCRPKHLLSSFAERTHRTRGPMACQQFGTPHSSIRSSSPALFRAAPGQVHFTFGHSAKHTPNELLSLPISQCGVLGCTLAAPILLPYCEGSIRPLRERSARLSQRHCGVRPSRTEHTSPAGRAPPRLATSPCKGSVASKVT